jgi:phage terminase large subunit-like protein
MSVIPLDASPEQLEAMLRNDPELQKVILAEQTRLQQEEKILFYEANSDKHLAFHKSVKKYRVMFGGNRSGKTYCVCAEDVIHLTGKYPDWWEGRTYNKPIEMWAASDTNETTRDILQKQLLGAENIDDEDKVGTGLLPKKDIIRWTRKRGIMGAVEFVYVRHYNINGVYDGESVLQFKAYEQGRRKFQGTAKDRIHLDEEPPMDVVDECYMRTVSTRGEIVLSMTPLQGETDLYVTVTEADEDSELYYHVHVSLFDNPHVAQNEKDALKEKYQGDDYLSRVEGVAVTKEGKIYTSFGYKYHVKKMDIQRHERRDFRVLDPGLRFSHVLWGYIYFNSEMEECVHFYKELRMNDAETGKLAEMMRLKEIGEDIDIELIDPAADRRDAQSRGKNTLKTLNGSTSSGGYGFNFVKANNDVTGGIQAVREMMRYTVSKDGKLIRSPRLTFDPACTISIKEHARYKYKTDKSGDPVKRDDHSCDCARYLVAKISLVKKNPNKKKKRFNISLNRAKYG